MVAVVITIPVRAAMILLVTVQTDMFANLTEEQFDLIVYTHFVALELLPCLAIMYAIGQSSPRKLSEDNVAPELSEPMKDLRISLRDAETGGKAGADDDDREAMLRGPSGRSESITSL